MKKLMYISNVFNPTARNWGKCYKTNNDPVNQGRFRLRASWAIAQGPRLSRGPKKGEKLKKRMKIDYQVT